MLRLVFLLLPALLVAETVTLPGLKQPVEILRDKWGVPHIYAQSSEDLFFAQGYMAGRDRMFQLDLWRRAGVGRLSEVLGPSYLERDRIAQLLRFRGDFNAEWTSYAPDTWSIAVAFTNGINAYVNSRQGKFTTDFEAAGYKPGLWDPNDILTRIPALSMMHNFTLEAQRAADIQQFGLAKVNQYLPVDPKIPIEIPKGLNVAEVPLEAFRNLISATAATEINDLSGSNNWVVSGAMSQTGKPLLASDPHRSLLIPSLRKTVHLVAPGWNVIGAGEPSLPGVALGHNDKIGFGFTITGIDQMDVYVETLHPNDDSQYSYKGQWKKMISERQSIPIRGGRNEVVELEWTMHGPVFYKDKKTRKAFVLRWVGQEPGTAGYLASLSLIRASNWQEFTTAMARFKSPTENMLYADVDGNIGWVVAGMTPIRKGWHGLLPVPGDSGEYEWQGFLDPALLPRSYNPATKSIVTANHNILPPGYAQELQYEWAPAIRADRIKQVLATKSKWSISDFEKLQYDTQSAPAKRLQKIYRTLKIPPIKLSAWVLERFLAWDGNIASDSNMAFLYELISARMGALLVQPPELGVRMSLTQILDMLEANPNPDALEKALEFTIADLNRNMGPDMDKWQWGRFHSLTFQHPVKKAEFSLGPMHRAGDANTVMAAGGANFRQTVGASFRQILDVADWDRSVMTNVPGESGDPASPHYSDLLSDWQNGKYHPMPFTRKAVEAATEERILLTPR